MIIAIVLPNFTMEKQSLIKISQLAESHSTLSRLAEILELRINLSCIEWKVGMKDICCISLFSAEIVSLV